MITRIKSESLLEAKQQVRKSHQNGFTVSHIKSEPKDALDSKLNPMKDTVDSLWMSTPYMYQDEPLVAFCEVDRGKLRIDKSEALEIHNIQLFTKNSDGSPSENVRDLYLSGTGSTNYVVQDTQGFDCYEDQVKDSVADCAAGTVCFPHVMTYDEYMTIQQASKKHMGFMQIGPDAYTKYLDKCESEISSGLMPYVGDVKDVNSLVYRRLDAMDHMPKEPAEPTAPGLEL